MKRILMFLLAAICACGLVGCGEKADADVTIDYGDSGIYSKKEMDEAISLIMEEFSTWEGCELHSISYISDEESTSDKNLEWMNDFARGRNLGDNYYTQCIAFISDFHSPTTNSGAWAEDYEYTDWNWWLARSEDGDWELLTWGY